MRLGLTNQNLGSDNATCLSCLHPVSLPRGKYPYQNIFLSASTSFSLQTISLLIASSSFCRKYISWNIAKMGQIEELPDDYDESQPPPPSTTTAPAPAEETQAIPPSLFSNDNVPFPIISDKVKNADPLAPELPPAMASIRSYTPDQLADMMNKTPLFMTDLDNAGDEGIPPLLSK
jgi:hypothetical protein